MKKNKNMLWSLVFILIAALSIWAVSQMTRNYSFDSLIGFICRANPLGICCAVLCTFGYIFFEGLAVVTILKSMGCNVRTRRGLLYSAADIYFSAITPSATGGQPASAYFMLEDGIPTAVSAITLVLNLVMYTASILVVGIVALIVKPSIFFHFNPFSKLLIVIGYLALGTLAVLFIILLKSENLLRKIALSFIRFFKKIHIIKNADSHENRLEKVINDYKNYSKMIDGHSGLLVKCFLFNFLQRCSQICVPSMVFLASGASIKGAIDVWVTQVFVTIGSNCVPIPGAMGVSDYLLLDGLRDMMYQEAATNMELASRGISFYSCVIMSIVIVALGYFIGNKKNKSSESK